MTNQLEGKPVEILLVEDNKSDARLAIEALRNSKIKNTIHHVYDGEEAMNFLHRVGQFTKAPRADLILLDLNLPKKDGREVLAELKQDKDLKRIPVIILTISSDEADIISTYNLYANCFITKPIDLDQFLKVVKCIEDFWLTVVKLPNGASQTL
jgi:two-component system, chemotaxis family, response regulator Rcp1